MNSEETAYKYMDVLGDILKALQKLPNWRFKLAMFILGEEVNRVIVRAARGPI